SSMWVALAMPVRGVSTREAFSWWDTAAERCASERVNGSWSNAPRWPELGNDLQAPVAAHHPELARMLARLKRSGATYAGMSGSGSAVFGLFEQRRDAERAVRTISAAGQRTWLTRTVNRAAYQRLAGIRHLPGLRPVV